MRLRIIILDCIFGVFEVTNYDGAVDEPEKKIFQRCTVHRGTIVGVYEHYFGMVLYNIFFLNTCHLVRKIQTRSRLESNLYYMLNHYNNNLEHVIQFTCTIIT